MKSLEQIAYEAGAEALVREQLHGDPPQAFATLAKSPMFRRYWAAVAAAVEREVVTRVASALAAERKRTCETVQCRCGARHMKGEQHICNDDPVLVAKLAGRA